MMKRVKEQSVNIHNDSDQEEKVRIPSNNKMSESKKSNERCREAYWMEKVFKILRGKERNHFSKQT
jgi:hypothetical protein